MPIHRRSRIARVLRQIARVLIALGIVAGVSGAEELVFLTWADYIDPAIVAEFEAESGSTVKIVVFEFDEARDRRLVTQGASAFDLIMLNGAGVSSYVRQGWLAPIGEQSVPNLRHISPRWKRAHEDTADYAVPYFWGTTGIAYRSDLVSESFHSWRQLMQPDEALRGRIAMIGASRELLLPALKMMGESLNVRDARVILQARCWWLLSGPL